MAEPIDPRVDIGHVHLKVADLDRALAFYHGVLGFEVTARMGPAAAFLSAGGYHHHIGLNTWESLNGQPPAPGTTGLYHVAIRYPDRAALADALRRLVDGHVPLEGASDHGVSEALYLRDPDGNGVELYWDRAKSQWPRAADGSVEMTTRRLDLDALLEEGCRTAPASGLAPLSAVTRARFADLRTSLLSLHKALLDDAKVAYEMDRGRIPSTGALLQLVIGDPWFAAAAVGTDRADRRDDGDRGQGHRRGRPRAVRTGRSPPRSVRDRRGLRAALFRGAAAPACGRAGAR